MGLSIHVRGSIDGSRSSRSAGDLAARIERWLEARFSVPVWRAEPNQGEELEAIGIQMHPSAEALSIEVRNGLMTCQARTTPAGPGYHQYVCQFLDSVATDFGLKWLLAEEDGEPDDTGYFVSRDRGALEDSFCNWLGEVCRSIDSHYRRGEGAAFSLGMPMEHRYRHDGLITTCLGPRDAAWLSSVLADPRIGTDVFPWWEEDRNGAYFLGSALSQMWTDIRWRSPLNERERALLGQVLSELQAAYERDPTLPFPWLEWHELLQYADEASPLMRLVQQFAEQERNRPLIGYRREDVGVCGLPGNWFLTIPGAFAEELKEDGTWLAYDESCTVRVSAFIGKAGASREELARAVGVGSADADLDVVVVQEDRFAGRAVIAHREYVEDPYWILQGKSAVSGGFAICTITFSRPEQRDWAVAAWRSLRNATP